MARGHQKIQAQQKAQEKKAGQKGGHSVQERDKDVQAAMRVSCPICKAQTIDNKMLKIHFEAKHPKVALPADLV